MTRLNTRASAVSIALLVALILVSLLSLRTGIAESTYEIVMNIRAPRLAMAITVGAGLAVAGSVMQGLFQNPLADPAIIGVSPAAAVGAVLAAAFGAAFNLPIAAIVAIVVASVGIVIVVSVARQDGRTQTVTLLLAGVAVASFAGALLAVLVSVNAPAGVRPLSFWLGGSFALSTWSGVITTVPFVLVGALLAVLLSRSLDLFSLGERNAESMGVNVDRTRLLGMGATVLLVAAGVAVAGVIAFVGLVIPHAVRAVIGTAHRGLIVSSALAGALLLVVADLLARTLASPVEIPVGAITALVGAPIFFVLLRRTRADQGGWG
jgi:iron complex transport system permease protein